MSLDLKSRQGQEPQSLAATRIDLEVPLDIGAMERQIGATAFQVLTMPLPAYVALAERWPVEVCFVIASVLGPLRALRALPESASLALRERILEAYGAPIDGFRDLPRDEAEMYFAHKVCGFDVGQIFLLPPEQRRLMAAAMQAGVPPPEAWVRIVGTPLPQKRVQ